MLYCEELTNVSENLKNLKNAYFTYYMPLL